jgi:hypothetical protein
MASPRRSANEPDGIFHAAATAPEELTFDALCTAETAVGQYGRVAHALPSTS